MFFIPTSFRVSALLIVSLPSVPMWSPTYPNFLILNFFRDQKQESKESSEEGSEEGSESGGDQEDHSSSKSNQDSTSALETDQDEHSAEGDDQNESSEEEADGGQPFNYQARIASVEEGFEIRIYEEGKESALVIEDNEHRDRFASKVLYHTIQVRYGYFLLCFIKEAKIKA